MKILVDADACPVKNIIEKVARELNLQVVMFIDTNHVLESDYSKVEIIGAGKDAVDMALINCCLKDDIVISQDYGVAAMALAKGAKCLNQDGLVYNENNIDMLLFQRHESQKARRAGYRTSNHKKRSAEDDKSFESSLRKMCLLKP